MEERNVPGQKQDMKARYRISTQIMDDSLYKSLPVVIIIWSALVMSWELCYPFFFTKKIFKLHLLHNFCVLYVIQVLLCFMRRILLVWTVLNNVWRTCCCPKRFAEYQTRRRKLHLLNLLHLLKKCLLLLTQDCEF